MPLSKAEAEERCGFEIPDEVWSFHPWGNRILARRLDPEEKFGHIHIPEGFKRQVSAGTIVKVGDCVGELVGLPGQAAVPVEFLRERDSVSLDPQETLVGIVITFNKFVGEEVHTNPTQALVERTYDDSQYILLQAVDIWGHSVLLEGGEKENEDVSGTEEG